MFLEQAGLECEDNTEEQNYYMYVPGTFVVLYCLAFGSPFLSLVRLCSNRIVSMAGSIFQTTKASVPTHRGRGA